MEHFLLYVVKSSLCSSVFLLIYYVFLKKETFYQFNRHFLLAGLLASIFIPFIQFHYAVIIPFMPPSIAEVKTVEQIESTPWITLVNVLIGVYGSGLMFFVIRHLVGLWKVLGVVKAFKFESVDGCRVVRTAHYKASFSIFKYIFIDVSQNSSPKEQQLILDHELAHAKGYHWLDLLVTQLFCSFQWFNPLIWIYAQAIKQNHEFLADDEVLKKGHSGAEYRAALINQSLKVPVFNFSSAFAKHDQIKRMEMMLKKASSPVKKWTTLFAVPLVLLILLAFAKPVYRVQVAGGLSQVKVKQTLSARFKEEAGHEEEGERMVLVSPKVKIGSQLAGRNGAQADTCKVERLQGSEKRRLTVRRKDVPKVGFENVALAVKRVPFADSGTFSGSEHAKIEFVAEAPIKFTSKPDNGNSPLYIVDGKETDFIEDILPSQIESISILKGTKGILEYGSRAANGVILIRTKGAAEKG